MKCFPCSTYLEGEYDLNDYLIGVPVTFRGKNGMEKNYYDPLSDAWKSKNARSADGVKKDQRFISALKTVVYKNE